MFKRDEEQMMPSSEGKTEITGKDILALMIAAFQILFPIFIIAVIIFGVLLLFLSKVWLRN